MRNQKLIIPSIYAIVNLNDKINPTSLITKILEAQISYIQIRDKSGPRDETIVFTKQALSLRDQIQPTAKIIINDFPEICRLCNADGVHLGQGDASPLEVRSYLGRSAIVGLSCHKLADLKNSGIEAVDYLAFGPIYNSLSKQGHANPVGTDNLSEFCNLSSIPVVAIGGIGQTNAPEVFTAGAMSCAMIGEVERSSNLSTLKQMFDDFREGLKI